MARIGLEMSGFQCFEHHQRTFPLGSPSDSRLEFDLLHSQDWPVDLLSARNSDENLDYSAKLAAGYSDFDLACSME